MTHFPPYLSNDIRPITSYSAYSEIVMLMPIRRQESATRFRRASFSIDWPRRSLLQRPSLLSLAADDRQQVVAKSCVPQSRCAPPRALRILRLRTYEECRPAPWDRRSARRFRYQPRPSKCRRAINAGKGHFSRADRVFRFRRCSSSHREYRFLTRKSRTYARPNLPNRGDSPMGLAEMVSREAIYIAAVARTLGADAARSS